MLERGDKLDLLEMRSDNLAEQAVMFRKSAKKLKRRMFIKNCVCAIPICLIVIGYGIGLGCFKLGKGVATGICKIKFGQTYRCL